MDVRFGARRGCCLAMPASSPNPDAGHGLRGAGRRGAATIGDGTGHRGAGSVPYTFLWHVDRLHRACQGV